MTVRAADLASVYAEANGESYPEVLSTPALIGLLERTCAALLAPWLQPHQMSVGVRVSVVHKAPTPLGAEIRATAQFRGREGRLFVFEVAAEDAGGVVATGEHARAIVSAEAVVGGAAQRLAASNVNRSPSS